MTFFSLILSKTIISKSQSKIKKNKEQGQKQMNYYYFGQNRFWYITK